MRLQISKLKIKSILAFQSAVRSSNYNRKLIINLCTLILPNKEINELC